MPMPDARSSQPKLTCPSDEHGPRLNQLTTVRPSSACTAKTKPARVHRNEAKTGASGPLLLVQGREVLPAMQQLQCESHPQTGPGAAQPIPHDLHSIPDCVPDLAAAAALRGSGTSVPAPHMHAFSPMDSPRFCQDDCTDFPDHGQLVGPLTQERQEFSEDDTPTLTGVQPKSWVIDGGTRCSAAAAGLTSQHSHQLPTLQVNPKPSQRQPELNPMQF